MSSKRHLRRKSCVRKTRYASQVEAQSAMGMLKRLDRQSGAISFMRTYPCPFCGGWHVGHTRGYNAYLPKEDRYIKS